MKKLISIIFLSFLFIGNAYSETGKIFLKCGDGNYAQIALIDFDNKLFDVGPISRGAPENLKYSITSVSDEKILVERIQKIPGPKSGGYEVYKVVVKIDRMTGTIADYKSEKLEDTRTDKSVNFRFMELNITNCKRIEMKKKF